MFVSLVLWDLSLSTQTVASLRSHLRDYAVEAYAKVPGLHQKIWVSSTGPEGETWGALYLWDTWDLAYGRPPGVSKVVQLIGYPPTSRTYFGVEAATEGLSTFTRLAEGIGLAYAPDSPPPPTRPAEHIPPGTPVIWRNRDRAANPTPMTTALPKPQPGAVLEDHVDDVDGVGGPAPDVERRGGG